MNRVKMQIDLENTIEQARMHVKSKKSLRDAVRVGVYQAGKRIFAVTDANTAYEVKDGQLVALSQEEYTKYIRPEYILRASYEFKDIPIDGLDALTKLFDEVGM
jgi:hypothetical protein